MHARKISLLLAALALPLAVLAESLPMTDAEVRRVDRENGKVTLRHGPIANLDMPAMTMVFEVRDRAALETLKPGDKVRFAADKVKGVLVVTRIEEAK